MAQKRPKIKKQITESADALKEVMLEGMGEIAGNLIKQIMATYRSVPNSKNMDAVLGLKPKGISAYRDNLLKAMAIVATEALDQVKKEIPKKVKLSEWKEESVMLGEFDDLPASIKTRLYRQMQLILGKQTDDVQNILMFQFSNSVNSTDSEDQIQNDLEQEAEDYLSGPAISSGANTIASQLVNEARSAYFENDDVTEQLDALEFVNEDPVSQICQDLAGTVFSPDDPGRDRYQPPLHFNCKSWIRPILKGNLGNKEIEQLKPSTKKLESQIQFSENLGCAHCGNDHF